MGVVRIGATRFVLYKEHAGIPLRRHERKKRCAGSRSVIYIYYTGFGNSFLPPPPPPHITPSPTPQHTTNVTFHTSISSPSLSI